MERPEITKIDVEPIDYGVYKIFVPDDGYVCDIAANPFFFFHAYEGTFSNPSADYRSVTFTVDEGTAGRMIKVVAGMGDGLGFVDKKAVLLEGAN